MNRIAYYNHHISYGKKKSASSDHLNLIHDSNSYRDIQNRLKTQEEKATRLKGQIGSIDYSRSLLDKMWVLCAFPPILNEFQQRRTRIFPWLTSTDHARLHKQRY